MITKLGLAQIVITRLFPKPTQDKKLTEPQAMLLVDHARDFLAKRELLQNRLEDKGIYGNWLSVFSGVAEEDENCKVFLQLPARPISLFKDFAIYQVWAGNDDDNLIIATRAGEGWLASNFSGYAGQATYYLEQDKLYFKRGVEKGDKINLRMLAMSEDIGAEDYYPFDGSMQGELIDLAVQRYAPTKGIPEDIINDNNSQ